MTAFSSSKRTDRWLVIFVKEPRLGNVKTRLSKGIGSVAATGWYRSQSTALLRRVSNNPNWCTTLAVSPDLSAITSRFWPDSIPRIPQGQGDLGQRMAGIFKRLSPRPTVIVGSDIPDITPRHIAATFRLLRGHDAVFGPCSDGGYWLVGLGRFRRNAPKIFTNVRWSSEYTLSDSIDSLKDRRIQYCDTLDDIDTAEDLKNWQRRHSARFMLSSK